MIQCQGRLQYIYIYRYIQYTVDGRRLCCASREHSFKYLWPLPTVVYWPPSTVYCVHSLTSYDQIRTLYSFFVPKKICNMQSLIEKSLIRKIEKRVRPTVNLSYSQALYHPWRLSRPVIFYASATATPNFRIGFRTFCCFKMPRPWPAPAGGHVCTWETGNEIALLSIRSKCLTPIMSTPVRRPAEGKVTLFHTGFSCPICFFCFFSATAPN